MNKGFLFWALGFLALVAFAAGLWIDPMDIDSAQYASLSREMADSGNYVHLLLRGNDYLDKPPLLFWISAASFELFGVSNPGFKWFPLLSAFFAVYATYRLGRLLYGERSGIFAALLLGTCQAWFLFTLDLRTDTLLSAWVIGSVWKLAEFKAKGRTVDALMGGVFAGLAMLSKGPLGLMIPLLSIGGSIVFERDFKTLLRPSWYWALALAFALLIPMAWGLYTQFDLHPEKAVLMPTPNGLEARSGVSGLRFFFWEQSFGRISGENAWRDSSGPFFFVHNFLWAFMPWSLFAVVALGWKLLREISAVRRGDTGDWLALSGLLIPFVALSASQYKLPHYIFPLFPFAALITAQFFSESSRRTAWGRGMNMALAALPIAVSAALSGVLLFWVFRGPMPVLGLALAAFGLAVYSLLRGSGAERLILACGLASVGVNLVLNLHFYPRLLGYQAGTQLAKRLTAEGADSSNTAYLAVHAYSFDFGMKSSIPVRAELSDLKPRDRYVVVDAKGLSSMRQAGFELGRILEVPQYPATQLSGDFLNPRTRARALKRWYGIEIVRFPES